MADIRRILKIEVPLIVRLAAKEMSVREVLDLAPGAVIHFETNYETALSLMANSRVIARGRAVKMGERFGLQISDVGDAADTLQALR